MSDEILRWVRLGFEGSKQDLLLCSHFYSFFLALLLFPTHFKCRWLVLHLITLSDTHTHTLGRTPLDERSARCRGLYLRTHKTYRRQTAMPTAVFEPAISASVRPQTYALDRVATGIGFKHFVWNILTEISELSLEHLQILTKSLLSYWIGSRGSSVGIATELRNSRLKNCCSNLGTWKTYLSIPSVSRPGVSFPLYRAQMLEEDFPHRWSGRRVNLTTHPPSLT